MGSQGGMDQGWPRVVMAAPLFGPPSKEWRYRAFKPRYIRTLDSSILIVSAVLALDILQSSIVI